MLPFSAISTGLEHVHMNIIHPFVVAHTQAERFMHRLLTTIYLHVTVSNNRLFFIKTTPSQ